MNRSTRLSTIHAAVLLVASHAALAQSEADLEPRPAIQARLADQALVLDIVRHDDAYVAVGERGHVLLSDDGRTWTQAAEVPVQSTLTRVESLGRRLWAVGHDSAIISSADGGQTWFVQHWDATTDEPLLDVEFLTAIKGYAVGAYGRFMVTSDGGVTWQEERIGDRVVSEAIDWGDANRLEGDEAGGEIDSGADGFADDEFGDDEFGDDDFGQDETGDDADSEFGSADDAYEDEFDEYIDKGCFEFLECHLNDLLVLDDGRLMIAAERGFGYRSSDGGETWESFRFPYTGSMFGLIELDECIIAFGLRGHIQKSCDFGDRWSRIEYDGDQGLMGGTQLGDGRVVLVGAAATRLVIDAQGNVIRQADRLGSDYAAVLAEDERLILVGEDGIRHE